MLACYRFWPGVCLTTAIIVLILVTPDHYSVNIQPRRQDQLSHLPLRSDWEICRLTRSPEVLLIRAQFWSAFYLMLSSYLTWKPGLQSSVCKTISGLQERSNSDHGREEAAVVLRSAVSTCCRICFDLHRGLPGVPVDWAQLSLEAGSNLCHDCLWLSGYAHWGLVELLPQHEEQNVPKTKTWAAHSDLHSWKVKQLKSKIYLI